MMAIIILITKVNLRDFEQSILRSQETLVIKLIIEHHQGNTVKAELFLRDIEENINIFA